MSDEAAKPSQTPSPTFWLNLLALCALAPTATVWFQSHFAPYFTEVVVVGGAFTLWALARLVWSVVELAKEVDVKDASRRALSQPETTRILLAGAVVFGVLWWTTGSLYFELAGAGEGDERVKLEVLRADGSPYRTGIELSSDAPLAGRPIFWMTGPLALRCRLRAPADREDRDCSVRPHARGVRIRAPEMFAPVEHHLIRLVPTGALYVKLPRDGDPAQAHYALTLRVGERTFPWSDLRKGVLITGRADSADVEALARRDDRRAFGEELEASFRAQRFPEEEAKRMTATLGLAQRPWGTLELKRGAELELRIEHVTGAHPEDRRLIFGPQREHVGADFAQTIWLGVNP